MPEIARFSRNQLRLIEWLATPIIDKKMLTQSQLAQEIGVNESTVYRWKNLPGFRDAVTARARELFGNDLPEIYGALRREAIKGSFQHIKLSMEMLGEHTEKVDHSGDLNLNVKTYAVVSPDDFPDPLTK